MTREEMIGYCGIALGVIILGWFLFGDWVKRKLTRPLIDAEVERDFFTTGRISCRVPDGAQQNPNSCFPFELTVQETKTIKDVAGNLHTVPQFRNPTLNEVREIMKRYDKVLSEHPELVAPADPSMHKSSMLWDIPDHQKKRMAEEGKSKRSAFTVVRDSNPEPRLPEGMKVVPDQST